MILFAEALNLSVRIQRRNRFGKTLDADRCARKQVIAPSSSAANEPTISCDISPYDNSELCADARLGHSARLSGSSGRL
jgi:hypothetical protein